MRLRPPRLWVLLLVANLVVLALPLGGLMLLRLYESALVRQTETELVAQAAVLSAAYRVQRAVLGPAADEEPPARTIPGPLEVARRAGLDLARDPILPPAPGPEPAGSPAILAARVGAALDPVLRAAQAVTLAALRITDARGVVVASTGTDLGLGLANLEEVRRALTGEFVTLMRAREHKATWVPEGISRGTMLRVHVAMPVIAEGRVLAVIVLSRTPADIVQIVWGKRWELSALLAVVLAVGAGLALAASRLITRPIGLVAAQARRVADGGTGAVEVLARPGTREVAELSAAIASMSATLERRAVYVRDLAAHVAHEFKTPIAAAGGAAELAGEPDISDMDRARMLGTVRDSLLRLERLTRRLLELARADMMPVRAVDVALAPVLSRAAAKMPELRIGIVATEARAAVTEQALEMMLDGLLDNVRAHAGRGAVVRISAETRPGRVLLRVEDDGPGVPAVDVERLFEPFFTTARARGGTGMGLPIVRALAVGAGGTARLAPSARGASFEVDLPAT